MWAGFFCRLDVLIHIFGCSKEFPEVRGASLMCNFGVRSRFWDVICGIRLPKGSPESMQSIVVFLLHAGAKKAQTSFALMRRLVRAFASPIVSISTFRRRRHAIDCVFIA